MAVLGLSFRDGQVTANARPDVPLTYALAPYVQRLQHGAPLVILVHGYKFSPEATETDPNRLIFSLSPDRAAEKFTSWPTGLGFSGHGMGDGLCLGFAWPAAARDRTGPAWTRFARTYDMAAEAGAALARTIDTLADLAPGRAVDIVAHSLGARVALQAMKQVTRGRLGQVILMGGAEWAGVALECLAAPGARGAQVYNITSRENDLFDLLFERFAPRPFGAHAPLSAHAPVSEGLGAHDRIAFDLPLDRPELALLLTRRGQHLAPRVRQVCHWSFFTRPGALGLYADMLRSRHKWTISDLKSESGQIHTAPRWSTLIPRLPWTPPDAGAGAMPGAGGM